MKFGVWNWSVLKGEISRAFAPGRVWGVLSRVFGSDASCTNRAQPPAGYICLANEEEGSEGYDSELVGFANALKPSADGWVQVAPKGEHLHGQHRQRVNSKTIQEIIRNFRDEAAEAGENFAGSPFYIGHPDVPSYANEYKDKKAYGWAMDLQERADGLYALARWSEPGRKLIENAHYKFLSPVWGAREVREGGKLYADPAVLLSIGLTNNPQIKGGKPLANERTKTMKKKLAALAALLRLANEASDDEILTGVEAKITTLEGEKTTLANEKATVEGQLDAEKKAHQATRTTLANEAKTLRDQFAAERGARIDLLLGNAVEDGRLTLAEKPAFRLKLANEATFDAAVTELAGKQTTVKTDPKTLELGGRKVSIANERDRRATVQELVAEKMTAKGMNYDLAFANVKRERPELFAAMTKPEAEGSKK